MDELTVEPDAEEPKRKRKRRRKRAVHANELTAAPDDEEPEPSKRKKDARNKQSTSPADRMTRTRKTVLNRQITTTQTSKGCRRNVLSSKRPHP